jgi:hypothetical protein
VDRKAQTVILPIHGFAVPFHINTIKNVSKNDEGDFTYLRVNFQTPGQLAGKKEDTVRQTVRASCPFTYPMLALRRPRRDLHPLDHVQIHRRPSVRRPQQADN